MHSPPFAVVYYSDGSAPEALRRHCLRLLVREVASAGGELVLLTWNAAAARSLCYKTNVWRVNARGYFRTPRLRRLLTMPGS